MLLAAAMPSLFVGLIAGVAVDRFDRKRIMICANLICAFIVAAIPILLPLGISWLYVLVALSSAVEQFFAPAQASVLPETAPEEQLVSANAMMTISLYGAVTIGFAAAGLIASMSTLTAAFIVDSLSFVMSALCIVWLEVAPHARQEPTSAASALDNLRAGLAFVRETPVLRSLVLIFGLVFVDYGLTNSLVLPFVKRAFRRNRLRLQPGGSYVRSRLRRRKSDYGQVDRSPACRPVDRDQRYSVWGVFTIGMADVDARCG